jgi:hypothetical protein
MIALDSGLGDRIRAVAWMLAFAGTVTCGDVRESAPSALAIAVEVGRLGQHDLWPDFDPAMVPLAIYDGHRTVLLGHPAPPPAFARDSAIGGWSQEGRHAEVVAGATARIGGVWTVTLIATDTAPIARLALRAVREAFHVMQRDRHPEWIVSDEAFEDVRVRDVDLLTLRRLENMALSRALSARNKTQAACWAKAAIAERRARHAVSPRLGALEWRAELNDGLAIYVEQRASGERSGLSLEPGYPPDAIRERAAATGVAFAMLLDTLRPDWREQLEHRTTALDALLTEAIGTADACMFRDGERAAAHESAARDISALDDAPNPQPAPTGNVP